MLISSSRNTIRRTGRALVRHPALVLVSVASLWLLAGLTVIDQGWDWPYDDGSWGTAYFVGQVLASFILWPGLTVADTVSTQLAPLAQWSIATVVSVVFALLIDNLIVRIVVKRVGFLAGFLLLSACPSGETQAVANGKLLDKCGQPLMGVQVTLFWETQKGSIVVDSARTGVDGEFEMFVMVPGPHPGLHARVRLPSGYEEHLTVIDSTRRHVTFGRSRGQIAGDVTDECQSP